MGTQLLHCVLPSELCPHNIEIEGNKNYRWDLIYKESYDFNRKRDIGTGLEIVGCRIDLREEVREGDRKYR